MSNIFDAVGKEFTFFQLEGDSVFEEDGADTTEIIQEGREDGGPKENVVDDNTAAEVRSVGRVTETEEGIPLILEHAHHARVKSGCVAGPERHHSESVLFVVGAKKGQFFLVFFADGDLMVAGFIVQADEV